MLPIPMTVLSQRGIKDSIWDLHDLAAMSKKRTSDTPLVEKKGLEMRDTWFQSRPQCLKAEG